MKNAKKQAALSRRITDALLLILCIGAIALIIGGCSSPTMHSPELSASLTRPCPPLQPLESKDGAAVLAKLIEVSAMYYDCADSKDALIKAVK